jgi:hypothetical protein
VYLRLKWHLLPGDLILKGDKRVGVEQRQHSLCESQKMRLASDAQVLILQTLLLGLKLHIFRY